MLKKILLPFVALSIFVIQPIFADAPKTETTASCPCQKHMDKFAKMLNLDNKQIADIKAIKAKSKDSREEAAQKMDAIEVQFKGLITAKKMDEAQLDSLIDQKTKLIGVMMKHRMMAKHDIYNLLNAKQQMQFQEMMNKEKEKWAHKKCLCEMHSS